MQNIVKNLAVCNHIQPTNESSALEKHHAQHYCDNHILTGRLLNAHTSYLAERCEKQQGDNRRGSTMLSVGTTAFPQMSSQVSL